MHITEVVEQLGDIAERLREGEEIGFAEDSAAIETAVAYLPLLAHALWVMLDGKEVVVRAMPGKNALIMRSVDDGGILIKRGD